MARKSKSMAANSQTAASPHLIPDLNEILTRSVVRGCDETAASLQASSLRSLWRTFRHGDASLVGQEVLQEDVQRRIPPRSYARPRCYPSLVWPTGLSRSTSRGGARSVGSSITSSR